jgi:hypothetical protein
MCACSVGPVCVVSPSPHTHMYRTPYVCLVLQHEFPVRGHPNTPFVMATTALWRARPGGGREAVLLVAALGDVGLTGRRVQGLVFHWSAVDADGAAAILADPAAAGSVAVDELPDGWRTQPELGWDAGASICLFVCPACSVLLCCAVLCCVLRLV